MGNDPNIPSIQTAAPAQMGVPMATMPPLLYMNSFKAGITTTDVFVVLQHNGADVAVLNISYTLAKSLKEALQEIIERLERQTGQSIMTATTVAKAMRQPPENKSP
jgi:hypothetical protein